MRGAFSFRLIPIAFCLRSLRPIDEVVLEDCYNDQDEEYDSEDSNQENYYTNDYPDDDEPGVLGSDEELCQQMNKFMFGWIENCIYRVRSSYLCLLFR